MQKLEPVEEAKALFEEAKGWGVWKWLTEKRRLRQTADTAWESLDQCEKMVKASWGDRIRKRRQEPEIREALKRLKLADQEAYQARMDAEAQFDEADRRMSTGMAREGAQMAIDAWSLREQYIRKMEALGRKA